MAKIIPSFVARISVVTKKISYKCNEAVYDHTCGDRNINKRERKSEKTQNANNLNSFTLFVYRFMKRCSYHLTLLIIKII